LDVYENEKPLFFKDQSAEPLQDELFATLKSMKHVLITGHQAFLKTTALNNIAQTTFYNLDCWDNNIDTENEIT
jgi:D-lactate dehydrogenase